MDIQTVSTEAKAMVIFLVKNGLAEDQNMPVTTRIGTRTEVTFDTAAAITISLKDMDYQSTYDQLNEARAFSAKLLDGALLQILYRFRRRGIESHRLAYFPSPYVAEFQTDPETYIGEPIFAEVTARRIVPVPIRFDYDTNAQAREAHPASHLSLGQYENCRIPVTSPVSPRQFVAFILDSFYNSAFELCRSTFPNHQDLFPECISAEDTKKVHVCPGVA
ncbi:MAG: DUF2290 domain-containing protein [Fimbriimonadales bacterium]